MGTSRYKDVRLSDTFVNLTDEIIHTYESASGAIWDFVPEPHEIPLTPAPILKDTPIVHYIVDRRMVHTLEALGRSLDDIAIVDCGHRGRDNIKISYFAWASDPKIPVCLYKNAHGTTFSHK